MKRFIMILSMMLLLPVFVFSACTGGASDGGKDSPFRLYIDGYEWGAGVYKIVMDFGGEVGGNLQESLQLTTSSGSRRSEVETVSAYNCDEEGNRADTATRYAAFVIYPDSNDASPVLATLSRSVWSDDYTAELRVREGKTITVGGRTMAEGWTLRHVFTADERVITATEDFVKDSFTHDGITLTRALYTPYGAGYDDGPNPMIVWLHGGGEGGTDIEIALLGSKVTALTDENIQQNFEDESRDGAYVLAVQCPTMWMDGDGNGTMNNADDGKAQTSYYTRALFAAIDDIVKGNPDIDSTRIYLGGCSNGGYMTVNMAINYGDYFAAYFPVCEGYRDDKLSDEQIADLADKNIWFVFSINDIMLDPFVYTVPTYARLILAGAENVNCTVLDKIVGCDDPEVEDYAGHWAWVTVLNDDVTARLDNDAVRAYLEEHGDYDCISPLNNAVSQNLWKWLSTCR